MASNGYIFVSTLLTLLVILDPPGLLPVFIGLTRTYSVRARHAAARRAAIVAMGVIGLFAIFGRFILDYLRISVEALQVAGGLLLLLVALDLLTGKFDSVDESKPENVNIAIVPLGTPLLAGPGAIVATMIAVRSAEGVVGHLAVAAALIGAMVAVWLFLHFATAVQRVLRDAGTTLLTRIAGLLLSAIAVQMMAEGVLGFIRTL